MGDRAVQFNVDFIRLKSYEGMIPFSLLDTLFIYNLVEISKIF